MLINPPTWTQNGSYTAEQDRRLISAIVRTEGVANASSMVPTVVSNSRQVSISAGGAYINGDYAQTGAGGGGMYFSYNDGAFEVALPVSGTIARYDLIVLRVYDSAVTGSINEARFEVVTGTPAASPRIPSVPGSAIAIAAVKINPGTTKIQASDISDQRTIAQFNGTISGNVNTAQASRLNQVASPTNPVLITQAGSNNDLRISTGSGFQSVGGTDVYRSWSDLPSTATEGAMATIITSARTYQYREGEWKFFSGWGPYISFGRTAVVGHIGPYVGGMKLNAGSPASWGSEVPKSASDYSSYYKLVAGLTGTSVAKAGGVAFKKPGKYHVEVRYQVVGKVNGTSVRSRIGGPGIKLFSANDNQETHAVINKGEERVISTSGTIVVGKTGGSTHGMVVPWLRSSTGMTMGTILFRVEMEYEF